MSVSRLSRIDCPCGCGVYGSPRARPSRDGLVHARRCPCKRCAAGRYRRNAYRREKTVARATGGQRNIASGRLGGFDTIGGAVEVEETAEVAVVRGFRRWYGSKTFAGKFGRLFGRAGLRPRAAVLSWDGKPQAVILPFGDLAQLCALRTDASALRRHTQIIRREVDALEREL